MSEKSRFNMVIPEKQKERWEEYVEENPDVTSLSQLVRQAVESEIAQGNAPNLSGGSDEVARERLSELLEDTKKIRSGIENIEDRLYHVEQEVRDNPEISELAADLFEILPSREDIEDYHKGRQPGQNEVGAGTVDEFAERLGTAEPRIERALEKLQNEIALVYTTSEFGDETRYYKEE
ncbi:hypothetical protein [Natrinema altunense]|uniref:Uncharacterized protein n=1 Tax=Natrinema altunense (strain JCM 12890 / CGMCC 1.3731 / AJ2) TaxID=1227494 RepID=L9ZFA6_NATA2|nr:hypothetical protein [Natrinema altunense]ELY84999.1 hypothetical protein C485_13560 [Natrinema altunense JCM 12890]